MYIIMLKNDQGNGDAATVMFNDHNQAIYAKALWDITPFIDRLQEKYPAPPDCEWRKMGLLFAKIVQR